MRFAEGDTHQTPSFFLPPFSPIVGEVTSSLALKVFHWREWRESLSGDESARRLFTEPLKHNVASRPVKGHEGKRFNERVSDIAEPIFHLLDVGDGLRPLGKDTDGRLRAISPQKLTQGLLDAVAGEEEGTPDLFVRKVRCLDVDIGFELNLGLNLGLPLVPHQEARPMDDLQ